MYVNYFYGMNTDGVDYDPIKPAPPTPTTYGVYNPTRAEQCDVTLDSQPAEKMSFHGFRNSQFHRAQRRENLHGRRDVLVDQRGRSGVPAGAWSWKNKITN